MLSGLVGHKAAAQLLKISLVVAWESILVVGHAPAGAMMRAYEKPVGKDYRDSSIS